MYKDVHDSQRLKDLQNLPLERKIGITAARITEWYQHYKGKVYVSFSGGKDSTVLLYLVRMLYPDVEAVFCDTGLEQPEIKKFVKTKDNVVWVKPKQSFFDIVKKFGYPIIGKEIADSVQRGRAQPNGYYIQKFQKDSPLIKKYGTRYDYTRFAYLLEAPFKISAYCCKVLKKDVTKRYENETGNKPIIGMLSTESRLRRDMWIKNGCNAFDKARPTSNPMSFWKEQDVLEYIYKQKIDIAECYGKIVYDGKKYKTTLLDRTGCMFCMFGIKRGDKTSRFDYMKKNNPKIYNYCIGGGCVNEHGMIEPTKEGLGIGRVLKYMEVEH